jgi:glycosyltransferase involved in cell wall biosynthesis
VVACGGRLDEELRILFVAMAESVHTARWVGQLGGRDWDIHVFDAMSGSLIPQLTDVTAHTFYRPSRSTCNAKEVHWVCSSPLVAGFIRHRLPALARLLWPSRIDSLTRLVKSLNPDIIHSLEMQNESYAVLEAKRRMGVDLPVPWIYSSWGSDLYYFASKPEHERRTRAVLGACDYYIADCQRDVELASKFGFKGKVMGVLPAVGGFDIPDMRRWVQPGNVCARRVIAVKGFQGWAGRALVALQALQLCADALRNYRVVVYGADSQVELASREVAKATGLNIEVWRRGGTGPDEIVRLFGGSRLAVAVSVSDGTPISMLEAMVMGAFPIQSDTVSTGEWIKHGKNGLLVPAEDPEAIAAAIRWGLSDDALVDGAARFNAKVARERLDIDVIRPKIIAIYEEVMSRRLRGIRESHVISNTP